MKLQYSGSPIENNRYGLPKYIGRRRGSWPPSSATCNSVLTDRCGKMKLKKKKVAHG